VNVRVSTNKHNVELPDFNDGLIVRRNATIDHVVSNTKL
jgi:ribosome-interacting GTPase 1